MRKLRFTLLFLKGLQKRYRNYFLVGFLIILFTTALFWKFGHSFFPKDEIFEGMIGLYTQQNLPQPVSQLLSKPLVTQDKTGKPQPELAQGWQVNNDSTLYTFKLKENLIWGDGTKVKSSDIKFNLPEVEVSYPNDQTIEFKLKEPFSPFPTFLIEPVFKKDSLVGVGGKFQVIHQEDNNNLITKLVLKPIVSQLPAINIRFYPDEKIAKTAFELGEVEVIFGFPSELEFNNQPSIKVKKVTNYNKLVAVFYNIGDKTAGDKNLRKALSFAIPWFVEEERAKTSLPPFSWAYNDQLKEATNNLDQAKSYLSKVENPKDLSITLTTTPAFSVIGEKIVESWKKVGLLAVLRVESGVPQNFQALLTAQSIPEDPDQYLLWHSTQAQTNFSRYDNKRVDKDLEDARKTSDWVVRKEKYFDFQKILFDDPPATFLYFPKTNIIYRQKSEKILNKILPFHLPGV